MNKLSILVFLIILFSCTSKSNFSQKREKYVKQKIHCIDELVSTGIVNPDYNKILEALEDTIYYFIGKSPHNHVPDLVNYKVDNLVLFNSNSELCLLFLLELYPNEYLIDNIRIIKGYRINRNWKFTLYPTISNLRKLNGNKRYTHEELSKKVKELLILKGIFTGNGCNFRENFLEEVWFNELDR